MRRFRKTVRVGADVRLQTVPEAASSPRKRTIADGGQPCTSVYVDYVKCLMIDFSRVFDVVDHPGLLAKLSKRDLPESIQNWIVSFLAGRSQSVELDCSCSSIET